jgi:hypothetical protein
MNRLFANSSSTPSQVASEPILRRSKRIAARGYSRSRDEDEADEEVKVASDKEEEVEEMEEGIEEDLDDDQDVYEEASEILDIGGSNVVEPSEAGAATGISEADVTSSVMEAVVPKTVSLATSTGVSAVSQTAPAKRRSKPQPGGWTVTPSQPAGVAMAGLSDNEGVSVTDPGTKPVARGHSKQAAKKKKSVTLVSPALTSF